MRVAFFVGPFPKLSKTFILDQITGVIDRGIHVDIYAVKPDGEIKTHPEFYNYDLQHRIIYQNELTSTRIKKIPELFFLNICNNSRQIINSLNFIKYGFKALSLSQFYDLIPFFNKKYDIIHAHFGPYGIQAQQLRDLLPFKGKVVTSFHGFDISTYIKSNGSQVYKHLFAKGDKFLPISNYWRDKLINLGCDINKIQVHHMGININSFQFCMKPCCINNKTRLISIARLTEKKGLEYSIKAVANLLKKNKNISYQIIGDGPLRKELQSMINEFGIQDYVILQGWKDRNEVISCLKESSIFLGPSVTAKNGDMEGIPMVLMEAMAIGLPVISTYHSGIPELIQDNISGFLVPEKNVELISEKIDLLINNPEIVNRITINARKYLETHFNLEKQNSKLINIYRDLI